MTMILINMGLAAVFGFFLSLYFFLYRLHFAKLWRIVIGSIVGVVIGCFLAVMTLMTVWPSVDYRLSIAGMGIITVITAVILLTGKRPARTINSKKGEVEGNGHVATCRIDLDPSTGS